ncbi:hypothetical protein LTR62_002844 [Meristemomyces frigidus]|uniref:Microsomal glutathione S-transferase 3 n=1 Tax=Meristemomyces frigidus TaxID=1508187 RepID=A0AAN7TP90_9PEZI|nr:hypothetical protein LTR62_002844 [Meristemomyces frigidus]
MASLFVAAPVVPKEFGWVVVATASTCFLGLWHGVRIGSFRKAAGVPYPKVYAESTELASAEPEQKKKMYLFNCAQRAHVAMTHKFSWSRQLLTQLLQQNYLENHPSVMITMLIAGLRYPLWSAGLGLFWMVSRVIYAVGYTRADKTKGEGRLYGSGFWLAQLGLFGLAGWTGVKMLL